VTVPSDRKEARRRERDEFLRAVVAELFDGNARWPGLWTRLESLLNENVRLLAVVERYENALRQIGEQQQKTLGWIRDWDIVFDEAPGKNPGNWQHVAFSIYSDLCEVDTWARAALAGTEESDQGGNA
jgi:hypothetical protein